MIRVLLAASVFTLNGVGVAHAQTSDRNAALGGPVVPGVCLLSREAIFANAAVGKAATARLQELTQAAQAEVEAERTPIETELRGLEARPAGAERDAVQQTLTQRWQTLQAKAARSGRELEATRVAAMGRIAEEAQPVIAQVYEQRGCGLLLDRASALGGNFANDLTAAVVEALDLRIQAIQFDRERLSDEVAPAAGG